jgi:phosphonate transport system permease protein
VSAARHPLIALRRQQLTLLVLAAVLLLPLYALSGFAPGGLLDAGSWALMGDFLSGFFPLRLDREFLVLALRASLESIAIASLGTALALLLGAPLALLGTRALSLSQLGPSRYCLPCWLLRLPFRWLALILRSVPDLLWALLFVRLTGLGPLAAILAIGIAYGGMLARVYNDIMESGALEPSQALMLSGAGRLQSFWFGVWPAVYPEFISYTVYRWECALRASVIMGFVGAGGLGQQLELSLRMFAGAEVATLLLAFMLLVLLADGFSALLRRSLA